MRLSHSSFLAVLFLAAFSVLLPSFSIAQTNSTHVCSWGTQTGESAICIKTMSGGLCTPSESTATKDCDTGEINGGIVNPTMQVTYKTRVINPSTGAVVPSGATVPQGTELEYEFIPHVYSDIYWFATGYWFDSPYGDWISGALRPPGDICTSKNYISSFKNKTGEKRWVYGSLSVNPPTKGVTVANATCTDVSSGSRVAKRCTLSTPGSIVGSFNFGNTTGRVYTTNAYKDQIGGDKMCKSNRLASGYTPTPRSQGDDWRLQGFFLLSVPALTIPHTVIVENTMGNPPSSPTLVPTLGAGASCTVGVPFSITMTATDPDNDTIRYGIDWDASGNVDEFVPPTGYVPSGTQQMATRTFSTGGNKTVKVLAQDSKGTSSGWATLTFSCSVPAVQCTDTVDNDGDGAIDLADTDCTDASDVSEFTSVLPPPQLPPPPTDTDPDLTIRAIPSLVRSGNTTKVHWSATNVQGCTVSGSNGDSWTGVSSGVGGNTSGAITSRTVYTLACIDMDDLTITKQAVVNILPSWREF